jgi:hypothetical protein
MTFATTIVAPPLLLPVFRRGGHGYGDAAIGSTAGLLYEVTLPADLFDLFERHLVAALTERGFRGAGGSDVAEVQELRRRGEIIAMRTLHEQDGRTRIRVESEVAIADWASALASAVANAEAEVGDVLRSAIDPSASS